MYLDSNSVKTYYDDYCHDESNLLKYAMFDYDDYDLNVNDDVAADDEGDDYDDFYYDLLVVGQDDD